MVESYRPLGLLLAWVTLHLTSGGIWLQQLVNFILTVIAWYFACRCASRPYTFAWIGLVANGAFFSGYIYLFHLHGVFYAPLLIFVAFLVCQQRQCSSIATWRPVTIALGACVVTGMFHPFAFLIFSLYSLGLAIERFAKRLPVHWVSNSLAVGLPVAFGLFFAFAKGRGLQRLNGPSRADVLHGWLISYRMLEASQIAVAASIALSVLAGVALGISKRERLFLGAVAGSLGMLLVHLAIPAVIGWIAICVINALRRRNIALSVLVIACSVLPIATGTGSPTYCIPVILPCVAAIADNLALPGSITVRRRFAVAVSAIALGCIIVLRVGIAPKPLNSAVRPLLAEKEKTVQMVQMFDWLDKNGDVNGRLYLCDAATPPAAGKSALDRTQRAPIDGDSFSTYVREHFGDRLSSGPALYLCFGGQHVSQGAELHTEPGRWAGTASIQR